MPTIIVTGAAGFIGSAVCRHLRSKKIARVIGIDKMTYAASREALDSLKDDADFRLIEADICDAAAMGKIIGAEQPDGIMHLAAETHVDRSIDAPGDFLQSNIVGTMVLLEATRAYWGKPARIEEKTISFPACLDGRSLWLARQRRAIYRRHALRAQFTLCRQ